MAMPWKLLNPHTTMVGVEYLPDRAGSVQVGGAQLPAYAFAVPATVTESITDLMVYADTIGSSQGGYMVDVYDLASLSGRPVPVHQSFAVIPVQDLIGGSRAAWTTETPGDTGPLWPHIDEPGSRLQDINGNNWIQTAFTLALTERYALAGGAVPSIAGTKRVAFVVPNVWVQDLAPSPNNKGGSTLQFEMKIGGAPSSVLMTPATYTFGPATFHTGDKMFTAGGWTDGSWDIPPAPGVNMAEALCRSGSFALHIRESRLHTVRIFATYATILYYPEDRVARGEILPGNVNQGWNRVTLATPTAGTWAKTAGHTYLVVVRPGAGNAALGLRYLSSPILPPSGLGDRAVSVLADSNGVLGGVAAPDKRNTAFLLRRSDNAWSADGQPFVIADVDTVDTFGDEIATGVTLEQQFVAGPGTVSNVGALQVEVRTMSDFVSGDLLVELTNDAGVLVAANAKVTITEDDLVDTIRTNFQAVRKTLTQLVSLTNGSTYRLRFTSSAQAGSGWLVQTLRTDWSGDITGLATPQPGVNLIRNGVTLSLAIVATAVGTAPSTPTGLQVTPIAAPTDGEPPYNLVTWDVDTTLNDPGVGSDYQQFNAYLVYRDGEQIAELPDHFSNDFHDTEALINVLNSYRIAMRRGDGTISPLSQPVSAVGPPSGCKWVLTSNDAPLLGVAYDDAPPRVWNPAQDTKTIVELWGNDGNVELTNDQWSGQKFDVTLKVSTVQTPPQRPGVNAFAPLFALLEADTSYICVRDNMGGRWYSSVTWSNATFDGEAQTYKLDVHVTELTPHPSHAHVDWVLPAGPPPPPPPPPPPGAPSGVAVAAPTAGATVSSLVHLSASATNATSGAFQVGAINVPAVQVTSTTWAADWDSVAAGTANGALAVSFSASNAGGSATSSTVSVTLSNVANPVPTNVVITNPTAGQTFHTGDTVQFSATAIGATSGSFVRHPPVGADVTIPATLVSGVWVATSTLGTATGTGSVHFNATNVNGTTSSATVSYTVAAAGAPTNTVMQLPSDGQTVPPAPLGLAATSSNATSGIFSVNDGTTTVTHAATQNGFGVWEASHDLTGQSGVRSIWFSATNATGSQTSLAISVTIQVGASGNPRWPGGDAGAPYAGQGYGSR